MDVPGAVKPVRIEPANALGPREPARNANLDPGDLTVENARARALARQSDAMHRRFDVATAAVAVPSSPWGSAAALG